jgi:homoserine dehydrogenase
MEPLTFAILGFGTVGRAAARLAMNHPDLRLTHVCTRNAEQNRADWVADDVRWTDDVEEVLASPVDVVVELVGGVQPAATWMTRALERGKHVVTANKAALAECADELFPLAHARGRSLRFEAAVGGGIPVIRAIGKGLASDRLGRVAGVLNGTCNYILSAIEHRGTTFDQALAEAQARGYAEADPSADLEGHDARAKLCLLARVGLRQAVQPEQITCHTVRRVSPADFAFARRFDCTIRQVSEAQHDLGSRVVRARVGPALVHADSPLARPVGNQNVVVTQGEFGGETAFLGLGAGGDPTAVAVVSDLLAIADHPDAVLAARFAQVSTPLAVTDRFVCRHYLRLVVRDRLGIIADLGHVLATHAIDIDGVLPRSLEPAASPTLTFAMTLDECDPHMVDRALVEISQLDFHVEPPVAMPILA